MALLRNITVTAVGQKPQLHGESVCLGVRTRVVKHMAAPRTQHLQRKKGKATNKKLNRELKDGANVRQLYRNNTCELRPGASPQLFL